MDIFENNPNKSRIKNFYVKDTVFVYENNGSLDLILRIQTQLLVNQYVTLEIIENPKLAFPVKNGKNTLVFVSFIKYVYKVNHNLINQQYL